MSRIKNTFKRLKEKNEGALIGFITAGDPTPEKTIGFANAMIDGGIDILELGLPFSDPIADGPTIQKANERSLKAGMNTDAYFRLVRRIEKKHKIPKVCLTYYNMVLQYGLERFVVKCRSSGIDGLVVPDLPIEEAGGLSGICRSNGVDLIFLAAPTTTEGRMRRIMKRAGGFIYVVSLLGVTGERRRLSGSVGPLLGKLKKSKIPLAVGFGISKPEHVREVVKAGADGAIVGSAFVRIIEEGRNVGGRLKRFASELKRATK